jgi:hypothetical protein
VLGDGIQVRAKNKKVQKVIDEFWNDIDNHMDLRIFDLCQELALYGEIFIRFFVNEFNGDVKIITVDPSMIDQIESDPENIEKEIRIHRRPIGPSATIPGQPALPTPLEQANFEGQWLTVPDDVLHFTVNKVSNAKRGKSDLATLLPWLRRYKDWLIDRVRINKYKAAFLWEITLAGADKRTIEQKMQEYSRPPEPGTIVVHNESEKWEAVQPHIDAGDAEPDGRAIKLMVAMGAGIPEHYLADGQNSNRATATEMSLPHHQEVQAPPGPYGLHPPDGPQPRHQGEAEPRPAAKRGRHLAYVRLPGHRDRRQSAAGPGRVLRRPSASPREGPRMGVRRDRLEAVL